uniref:CheR family methyltransferase n=2 Tax=Sphingomonas sp. GlSt437 TaxID=3389970 RepID=UPI003A8950F0
MLIPRLEPGSPTPAMSALATLLEKRTGQRLAANRSWRIETELKPVMRALGLETLEDLVAAYDADPRGKLGDQIVDALLNQETSFFRDGAVLDMVADAAMAMAVEHAGRRIKVWSAGCANGQEPLSLAMLFAERARQQGLAEPEILATDVSDAAISRARAGRFSQFEIQRGLPVRRMIEWFEADGPTWTARPDLVRRIVFRRHNLVGDVPPVGRFDIVLCRNVLLYLSADQRQQVFDAFARVVRPGGLLVLGAGETVIGQSEAFVPSARYRGLYEPAPGVRLGLREEFA